ncbi:hypothetical protein EDB81DRAFT_898922 [Dactylonectria macrodidyma]|uniref:Uncharacterized protein n=1 Tax=Dactylonectria macrodidyma TaxID=307937 RepID=A0A9P9J598_9HYPO|nr:hypothetical protein EDB81DRAFT_898922 [Dactylonectria macrodidyma]
MPIPFAHTFDIAKYVDLVLNFEKWHPEYHIVGDKMAWNEFVMMAKKIEGYVPESSSLTREHKDVSSWQCTYSGQLQGLILYPSAEGSTPFLRCHFYLLFDDDLMDFDEGKAVNQEFPGFQPLKFKDAVERRPRHA